MKLSLSSKIVLAFSLIILTGMFLMVSIVNYTTRSGYENFSKENDIEYSKHLAITLSEYYSISDSWIGVDRYMQVPKPRMGRMNDKKKDNRVFPPILLIDQTGRMIINTTNKHVDTRKRVTLEQNPGEVIKYNGEIIGYISVGSMMNPGLTPKEEGFLYNIKKVIIFVSLFILTISIIFSYYFSRRLTDPIRQLSKSANEIKNGNYNCRVYTTGEDEIGKLSTTFNNMAESLKSNDTWRKQIIADSAHELRTPVTLIQGNLELILEGVYKADDKHIQKIYDETLVLSRLIKELQLLSSAESGSMELNKKATNLNSLIDGSLEIFRSEELKDNIILENLITSTFPKINVDEHKLKQVFSNILSNAFRHTPTGGKISISSELLNDSLIIRIKDNGNGIDEADLEKIFERFYRTDSARNRKHGGSGLGLAISREIIKLHGGSIHAESILDKGTTIIISLPIYNQ